MHFSFLRFFSVSRCIPCPTVCFSFSMIFSFLTILQFSQCAFLILNVFEYFSPYYRLNTVCVSFFRFFSFLANFQVIKCAFLICQVFSVSRHILGPTMCISHFPLFQYFLPYSRSYSVCVSFSKFFSFLTILQVLQHAFLIFHLFQNFSTYSRSYSVSQSPRFSVFSP